MKPKPLQFPSDFLWGAATAAHQVEGGNFNDWAEWERKNSQKLAATAKSRHAAQAKYAFSIPSWEKIEKIASDPQNYISGIACDHYHRFEEDFNLAQKLSHNAHRISIEWSRIEPEPGEFNQKEIGHYQRVILALKKREIEPIVSLWHFTLPVWVQEKGGWKKENVIDYFADYTKKIVRSLKTDVKFWVTINEPMVYAAAAYFTGDIPPQERSLTNYIRVIKNLIKAHKTSYKIIKKINQDLQVGIAKNNVYFEAYKNRLTNCFLKILADRWWNYYLLDKTCDYLDFIGLNHYFHNRINWGFNKNENKIVSDMGWELHPKSIYYALKGLRKYQKPIYITENGLADGEDKYRAWYTKEILKNVYRAIQDDVDVRGYLHWSLLDNFEWDKGFWPRFGLMEVDYKTLERKIRPSAREYAKIIRGNRVV